MAEAARRSDTAVLSPSMTFEQPHFTLCPHSGGLNKQIDNNCLFQGHTHTHIHTRTDAMTSVIPSDRYCVCGTMLCHVERLLLWFNLGGLLQYYATRTFQIIDPLLQERSNRSVPSLRALSVHTVSCHLRRKSSLDVVQASIKPSRYRDL